MGGREWRCRSVWLGMLAGGEGGVGGGDGGMESV